MRIECKEGIGLKVARNPMLSDAVSQSYAHMLGGLGMFLARWIYLMSSSCVLCPVSFVLSLTEAQRQRILA